MASVSTKIDLLHATKEDLIKVKDVGEKTAKKILETIEQCKGASLLDELKKVLNTNVMQNLLDSELFAIPAQTQDIVAPTKGEHKPDLASSSGHDYPGVVASITQSGPLGFPGLGYSGGEHAPVAEEKEVVKPVVSPGSDHDFSGLDHHDHEGGDSSGGAGAKPKVFGPVKGDSTKHGVESKPVASVGGGKSETGVSEAVKSDPGDLVNLGRELVHWKTVIGKLGALFPGLNETVKGTARDVKGLRDSMSSLQGRVTTLEGSVSKVKGLEEKISTLETDMAATLAADESYKQSVTDQFDQVHEELGSYTEVLDTERQRIGGVETRQAEMSTDVGTLEGKVRSLFQSCDDLKGHDARIEALETMQGGHDHEIKALLGEVTAGQSVCICGRSAPGSTH